MGKRKISKKLRKLETKATIKKKQKVKVPKKKASIKKKSKKNLPISQRIVDFFRNSWLKIVNYFKGVWLELKKVSWPSRKSILLYTMVTLTTIFIFVVFIGICDFLFTQLIVLLQKIKF